MWDRLLCSLGHQWFWPWRPFCPVSLTYFLTSDLHPVSEACRVLDDFLGSFVTCWLNHQCVPNWLVSPGKGHHWCVFPLAVDDDAHFDSLASQSLTNGFVILSTLIDVNVSVSFLFLCFIYYICRSVNNQALVWLVKSPQLEKMEFNHSSFRI